MRAFVLAGVAASLLVALPARPESFPARTGETGILDVPDAESVGPAGGEVGVELGVERTGTERPNVAGLPIYAVGNLASRLDVGLTMRQIAAPGDPRPARVLFGAAVKYQLLAPFRGTPGLAISTILDRFNERGILGTRLVLSTGTESLRLAAFAGGEATADGFDHLKATGGLAAELGLTRRLAFAAEALAGGRGENFGGALRWRVTASTAVSAGLNWFPGDDTYRFAVTLAFIPPLSQEAAPAAPAPAPRPAVAAPTAPRVTDARPHFRLRMHGPASDAGAPRRQQYGPYVASAAAASPRPVEPGAAAATKSAAPSLEDLADAQLRDQEVLAATRERRIRATAEELAAREKTGAADAAKLADAEKALATREQQLDARQRLVPVRGPPTQQQRQLESLEAQLASEMQKLSALERSYLPALDAAQGRERDASAREEAERAEAKRLADAAAAAPSRTAQLDLRKQALGAKNRELAALEAHLVALGERLDVTERQLHLRQQRLDAWSRKLDARAEKLDTLEQANSPKPPPAQPKPTGAAVPATPKDKAAFVMVVKSPTAILKEKSAGAGPQPTAAPVHGGAMEKAVAAATIVAFPTPATQLSELDRETLENIAKLAAKDRCELLIWARAKDPSLMSEAQRRATELQTLVMSAAKLEAGQVVTRITMRPGAQGVDVVVSALRESAKPAAAAPAAPAAPALAGGESGKRQIREAVQAAQPAIELCIGEHLQARRLQRAEGSLKLTVSAQGRIVKVTSTGGDLASDALEACLGRAGALWQFPIAEADYVVDVPIAVIPGGPAK